MLTPHGLDFDGLLGCLLEGLGELGVVVKPEQAVFACMPSLGRAERAGAGPLEVLGYAVRWRGLLAAERAGAAHLIDNCVPPGALWGWEVDDPTWGAALDTLDVAMCVAVLDMEGLPVTSGLRAAQRLVLEIAGASLGATAS
jgi:hypothetical protein